MEKRIIAVYLPQFHPIPENNKWWGEGFTEWTNVVKAKPLFKGHYQPHLPSDLGFYDLRVPETREAQAAMARKYGIYGFCYYHYWFSGKRLLERPFNEVLQSRQPDFPFMLCWANESWTRSWDGGKHEVLMKQEYSDQDYYNHIHYLLSVFDDPRYIRVNGKPVFIIYRSTQIPDINRMIEIWRKEALKKNMELYLCRFESFGEVGEQYIKNIFDANIEFSAHVTKNNGYKSNNTFIKKVINKISRTLLGMNLLKRIESYPEYVKYLINKPEPDYKCFPTVVPMWDNTARKKNNALIFINSNPYVYKEWLLSALSRKSYSPEENFVFINAWNEWAEGNHLEPDQRWGKQYLEATKQAINKEK